jgi:mono/diheme cytochrome c family protein
VNAPTIPDFTNRTWQQSRNNVQMSISILEGKDQRMPPNAGIVSPELARELAVYVRRFGPKPEPVRAVVTAPTSATGSPGSTGTTLVFTPTGDLEVDLDTLSKQFDDLQRQYRELAAAPPRTTPAPVSSVPADPPEAPTVPVSPPLVTQAALAPEKPRVAAVPVSERPVTADDVARGEELFLGRRALANGGPACAACHAVNRGEAREGGRLGPELTKAYERLGGAAGLRKRLWSPVTPTMHAAYLQHHLESDEVLCLAAYLEDADRHATADVSPLPTKSLLLALGGTVLGLAGIGMFWGGRARAANLARRNGEAAAALSTSADCVGGGL